MGGFRVTINRREGLRRVGIVAAVLWFAYWIPRVFDRYQNYRKVADDYAIVGNLYPAPPIDLAWDQLIDTLTKSLGIPIAALVAALIGFWVYRGFRAEEEADNETGE